MQCGADSLDRLKKNGEKKRMVKIRGHLPSGMGAKGGVKKQMSYSHPEMIKKKVEKAMACGAASTSG